jgi:hypothetical protein
MDQLNINTPVHARACFFSTHRRHRSRPCRRRSSHTGHRHPTGGAGATGFRFTKHSPPNSCTLTLEHHPLAILLFLSRASRERSVDVSAFPASADHLLSFRCNRGFRCRRGYRHLAHSRGFRCSFVARRMCLRPLPLLLSQPNSRSCNVFCLPSAQNNCGFLHSGSSIHNPPQYFPMSMHLKQRIIIQNLQQNQISASVSLQRKPRKSQPRPPRYTGGKGPDFSLMGPNLFPLPSPRSLRRGQRDGGRRHSSINGLAREQRMGKQEGSVMMLSERHIITGAMR